MAILLLSLIAQSGLTSPQAPLSLKGVKIPISPGLYTGYKPIIRDKKAAIILGKSLFWDMAVGSDGIACASCHFHAGADIRTRNQIDPGSKQINNSTGGTFEKTASGGNGGPNYQLKSSDFPMFQFADPTNPQSQILFKSDDVVSSSGVFGGKFKSTTRSESQNDVCLAEPDPIFHQENRNTRRVSLRNAPTVINAAFNYRNFWDGRANNIFNGQTPYGFRDKLAGIYEYRQGLIRKTKIHLKNASLASQAVAPPLDHREMSCEGRSFKALAERLLYRKALEKQRIAPDDSVLGGSREANTSGLRDTYEVLIKRAFDPRYWGAPERAQRQANDLMAGGRQIEANFAFFFGLSIQAYEATLISDQTPIDGPIDHDGLPRSLSAIEKHGLRVFQKECMLCHQGPTLTAAAHPEIYTVPGSPLRFVDRREINGDFDGLGLAVALLDLGFSNTSVTPTEQDIGLGGRDPYGHPLSFSEQYYETLLNPQMVMIDPVLVSNCNFQRPFGMDFKPQELKHPATISDACRESKINARIPKVPVAEREAKKFERGRLLTAVQGAFKIPGLRNIELTGPYMHNGSMKNLEEVLSFYDRGGNTKNTHHIANQVFQRPFSPRDKEGLLAFLKTLTDDRVRFERAPFDHPSLRVPHGALFSTAFDQKDGPVEEALLEIQEVGRSGRKEPLQPFDRFLQPL